MSDFRSATSLRDGLPSETRLRFLSPILQPRTVSPRKRCTKLSGCSACCPSRSSSATYRYLLLAVSLFPVAESSDSSDPCHQSDTGATKSDSASGTIQSDRLQETELLQSVQYTSWHICDSLFTTLSNKPDSIRTLSRRICYREPQHSDRTRIGLLAWATK